MTDPDLRRSALTSAESSMMEALEAWLLSRLDDADDSAVHLRDEKAEGAAIAYASVRSWLACHLADPSPPQPTPEHPDITAEASRSAWVKANRDRLGLSQQQLADRLGVTQQAVSQWENGTTAVTRRTALAIATIATDLTTERRTMRGGR